MRAAVFLFSLLLALPTFAAQSQLYGLGIPDDLLRQTLPLFKEAQKGNWGKAKKMAESKGKITQAALKWYYLSDDNTSPSFVEFETFLLSHPSWPEEAKLKRRAENALVREVKKFSPQQILKWFGRFTPTSRDGLLLQLNLTSDIKLKDQIITKLWTKYDFSLKDENAFVRNYQKYIPNWAHMARARRLMDEHKMKELERVLRFLNRDQKKLYLIRKQIMRADRTISHLRASVPKSMMTDPGYLMQILAWCHKHKQVDLAEVILLEYKPTAEYQTEWENIRRIQSREVMKFKRYRAAHDIAHRHSYSSGEHAADFEWFSGWVALEYMNDPQKAIKHFSNVQRLVKTNLSLSRVYYWLGRANAKAKQAKQAQSFYRYAAQYGWTFYGQLAASELKTTPNMTPIKTQAIPPEKSAIFQAAQLFAAMGDKKLARKFLQHGDPFLTTAGQHLTLSYFAKKLGITENVVRFARAAQNAAPGIALEAYPRLQRVFKTKEVRQGLDPALVHAIILQESRFEEGVVSFDAGQGYMQLMMPTAKRMAKEAGVAFNPRKLLQGDYNILMGTTYLRVLSKKFDGFFPFIAPSYNAGEDRVAKWLDEFGNPATDRKIDIVNWAESLTYVITRGYIQRILENVYVYRHVLKSTPKPETPWFKNWNLALRR